MNNFNKNLQEYIINIKNKWGISIRIITLNSCFNKKNELLIGLSDIFYALIKSYSNHKLQKESSLTKTNFHNENIIRNYIINSKTF